MNNEFQNELDWMAFCYAAGELSQTEAEQFETRLAAEQPAREALARAVELTQAVAVAELQPSGPVMVTTRLRAKWTTRLSWMAIGGLATLLVAVLSSGIFSPKPTETAMRPATAQNAEMQRSLAAAWSEARLEIATAREDGSWPTIASPPSESDDGTPLPTARGEELALEEAPSWMTTAVLGLAGMPSDDNEASEGPFNND